MRRIRQLNAWLERGYRAAYCCVALAGVAAVLAFGLGLREAAFFVVFMLVYGGLAALRARRNRRRRWAVRFANGKVHAVLDEREARTMADGDSWGHPALLHRATPDADWVDAG